MKFIYLCTVIVGTIFYILILTLRQNQRSKNSKLENPRNEVDNMFSLNPKSSLCHGPYNKTEAFPFMSFVIIAPHFFKKRTEIRNTWANKRFEADLKVIFVVGMSQNETVNNLIRDEFELHQDILQISSLIDSYYRMTLKIMSGLIWINNYCENAELILRINDDVIVNTPQLIKEYRDGKTFKVRTNRVYALILGGGKQVLHKSYVTGEKYVGLYPRYPQGSLFIFKCSNYFFMLMFEYFY